MSYDSTEDTRDHIHQVRNKILDVTSDLAARALRHDASKLEPPEKAIFDKFTPKLKTSTYGSDEYKSFLKEMKVALDHHYKVNDHHPEHFELGINDMNLVQVIEMLADWKAATLRHDDGDLTKSIHMNAERFGYGIELEGLLLRTANYFGWL